MGTAETRCLLAGHDLLFIGNSVVRRQMYSMLDLLAGPSAHRQLSDFSSVSLPAFKATPAAEARIKRSWIWDQDNATYGYHAAQLFTIDLATGEHRSFRRQPPPPLQPSALSPRLSPLTPHPSPLSPKPARPCPRTLPPEPTPGPCPRDPAPGTLPRRAPLLQAAPRVLWRRC